MPIRFACEHCDSTLNASSRKAGERVTCPKCRQKTLVPQLSQPAAVAAASSTGTTAKPVAPRESRPREVAPETKIPPPAPPVSETVAPPAPPPADESFGPPSNSADEVVWVYEAEDGRTISPGESASDLDFDRVSLPRYVLYGQGVLIAAVALIALTLGILIGRGSAPRVVERQGGPKPCFLTGTVTTTSSGGTAVPDRGAVVIVLPQDRRPADKAPIEGLRPDDPLPAPEQPSIARIKAIGGDYIRTDEQGQFKVRVPDTGEYFLLVVSHGAQRKANDRIESVHLAQMGRYFSPAPELIGDRQYRWRGESVKRDKEYKFAFE